MLFPDPFDNPYEYWLMVVNCPKTPIWKKRQQLKSVGLDYDVKPKEKVA